MQVASARHGVARRFAAWGDLCPVPGTRLTLGELAARTWAQAERHQLATLGGNLAFRLMLAVLPGVIAVLWFLRLFEADGLVQAALDLARLAFPGAALEPIEEQLARPPEEQSAGRVTPGVAIALAVTLWATTLAFRAFMRALNVVYGVEDRRPEWRRIVISAGMAGGVFALLLLSLVLTVFGSRIATAVGDEAGLSFGFRLAWALLSWAVIIVSALGAFTLAYYVAPDVQQEVRWVRFGSVTAVALWLGFTALFSLWVNVISDPEETYGALAGVALFMLYLYGSTLIVLAGAEMNQVIESYAPDGKDSGDREMPAGSSLERPAET